MRLRQPARAVHEEVPVVRELVAERVGREIGKIGQHARAIVERGEELRAIVEVREIAGLGVPTARGAKLAPLVAGHPGDEIEGVDADVIDRAAMLARARNTSRAACRGSSGCWPSMWMLATSPISPLKMISRNFRHAA